MAGGEWLVLGVLCSEELDPSCGLQNAPRKQILVDPCCWECLARLPPSV